MAIRLEILPAQGAGLAEIAEKNGGISVEGSSVYGYGWDFSARLWCSAVLRAYIWD
jgi:hypothetical protein